MSAVDPRRRLEDLSEDDYDEGSESDDEELGALKRCAPLLLSQVFSVVIDPEH